MSEEMDETFDRYDGPMVVKLDAKRAGGCNVRGHISADGTRDHTVVYEITLGGSSLRVCPDCRVKLSRELTSAVRQRVAR